MYEPYIDYGLRCGVQILFGFLLTAPFTTRFARTTTTLRGLQERHAHAARRVSAARSESASVSEWRRRVVRRGGHDSQGSASGCGGLRPGD
jgi:hypothetical protein